MSVLFCLSNITWFHLCFFGFVFFLKSLKEILIQNVKLTLKAYFMYGPFGIQSQFADEVRGNQQALETGVKVIFSRIPYYGERHEPCMHRRGLP